MKMYEAEIIADSISPEGNRITSVKVVYPHAVHKDMLRHRCMNRNVESFRAQPPEVIIEGLLKGEGFKPDVFAKRVKGMGQSGDEIDDAESASRMWDDHVRNTIRTARAYLEMDLAKQQVNFLLQDLCPLTEIITATDWDNFFALRLERDDQGNPIARPEVFKTAMAIKEAIDGSTPTKLEHDWLHLPMLTDEDLSEICRRRELYEPGYFEVERYWIYVSAGRCARISYGDFEWWKEERQVSYLRAERLLKAGHMSPFEQQAKPFSVGRWNVVREMQEFIDGAISIGNLPGLSATEISEMIRQLQYSGNLHGWVPARKMFANEWNYAEMMAPAEQI